MPSWVARLPTATRPAGTLVAQKVPTYAPLRDTRLVWPLTSIRRLYHVPTTAGFVFPKS